MVDLTILRVDDWEAVYIDGLLYDQNHSVDNDGIIDGLIKAGAPINFRTEWVEEHQDEFGGIDFPEELKDFPL